MEKPCLIFAFGCTEDSYFIGCGEVMEWNALPPELDLTLRTRARSVLSISLGENSSYYCRYISRKTRREYTTTGNIPSSLKLLLNAWWTPASNPEPLPQVCLGERGGYYFQRPAAVTLWDRLPKRLDEILVAQKRDPETAGAPPKQVALGKGGSYIVLNEVIGHDDGDEGGRDGVDEEQESAAVAAHWDGLDDSLTEKMESLVLGEKRVVENAFLSLHTTEDYLLTFTDNSIFYSVSNALLPTIQRFVKLYHDALIRYNSGAGSPVRRKTSPGSVPSSTSTSTPYDQLPSEPITMEVPDDVLRDPARIEQFVNQAIATSAAAAAASASRSASRSNSSDERTGSRSNSPRKKSGIRPLTKSVTWTSGIANGSSGGSGGSGFHAHRYGKNGMNGSGKHYAALPAGVIALNCE